MGKVRTILPSVKMQFSGIIVCVGLVLTFLHANSVLRQQVYNIFCSQSKIKLLYNLHFQRWPDRRGATWGHCWQFLSIWYFLILKAVLPYISINYTIYIINKTQVACCAFIYFVFLDDQLVLRSVSDGVRQNS